MATLDFQPARGPSAWTGQGMRDSRQWIYELDDEDRADVASALSHVRTRGLTIPFGKEDFPLGRFAVRMARILAEVETGAGVVLMRGLAVDEYGLEGTRLVYWGLGVHMGTALAQTPFGDLLVDVRDTGGDQYRNPTQRGFHTARRLPFHNDQGDVVGLLCYRRSKSGGLSCIASAAAVHNEILRTRPDLLEVLYQPFYCDARGEEPPGRPPYYVEPRFSMLDGRLFTQHGRTYVDSAQRFPDVPRLTAHQDEAMRYVDELCASDTFRLDMDFRRGDIQFLNNRVVLHSRTDFEDYEEPELKRLLMRLWLRTPGYGAIPAYFHERFQDMDHWLKHPLERKPKAQAA
ncbi:TauD/TfdA family dioxygenase [Pigmentiphaga sp. NML080357]|uniref:TauD/TfdA family dioxygenase n=1 Tax=Pigmentiphaga sp. NML080357 TaxID=2008675 RepID=UPI0013034D67|nr:TauD/TfdA family dioxygenase [Pigmentiphaga sp. NML080357]